MKIHRSKLNLAIDILMFMVMTPVAGIGFLMKYVLIPGFRRNDIYGRDVELYFWGIDRHQWGTIHLILSFVLLFLLLLHIVFHWKQIVGIFKMMVSAKVWRIILSSLLVLFTVVFGIIPLFLSPQVEEGVLNHASHNENTGEVISTGENQVIHEDRQHANRSEIVIYGNMTLNEVAEKYNVPAQELAKTINVPAGNNNERLGRLRKRYPFQLNDLRDYIERKTIK